MLISISTVDLGGADLDQHLARRHAVALGDEDAGDAAADPWHGRISRENHLRGLLRARAPKLEIRDLSPILNTLREIKSPAELAIITRATRIGGEALIEAMRSTAPGLHEYELDALAQFIFVRRGAQGEAYRVIVASGPAAMNAHHRAGEKVMTAGDPNAKGSALMEDYTYNLVPGKDGILESHMSEVDPSVAEGKIAIRATPLSME